MDIISYLCPSLNNRFYRLCPSTKTLLSIYHFHLSKVDPLHVQALQVYRSFARFVNKRIDKRIILQNNFTKWFDSKLNAQYICFQILFGRSSAKRILLRNDWVKQKLLYVLCIWFCFRWSLMPTRKPPFALHVECALNQVDDVPTNFL